MGMKTSAVLAAGGVPISMDGSTAGEGRTTLVDPAAAVDIPIPVPVGTNTLYGLRIEVFAVAVDPGPTTTFLATRFETTLVRNVLGNLQASTIGMLQTLNGLSVLPFSFFATEMRFQLPAPGGAESREYAWRWVLSPGYPCPFSIQP